MSREEDDLAIEGEVLVLGPEPDLPGDTLSIPVSKYRVLRVVKGHYGHPFILVGHRPEDRLSLAFIVNAPHLLDLTRTFPSRASLLNPFINESMKLGVYFCRSLRILRSE